jgi:hypothetical protein
MRARPAIVFAVAGLALVVAAQALALGEPDLVAPDDQASFQSGSQITFSGRPTNGAAPPQLNFYIWEDAPPGSSGEPTGFADHFQGGPTSDDPTLYAATRNPNQSVLEKPGTYYWQAVYHDCIQNPPECFVRSLPRSLTITPLPAAAVTSATQIETFLDRHPRRRTQKRKVKFKFSSNVAGASFRCLFARGWADCKSPHVFRHLEPGRYKFKARAVVNGLEDPTPVSWVFRILPRD